MANFICLHFNHCRDIGEFPQESGQANTIPVNKKKEKKEVQLHLKVKEQDISLIKNYCITINIKIISSIHIFIFKIQVLGSHELKSHCHLWQGTLKNDWINFQPSCICTSMQKIRLYILESHDQTGHTHFWPCPPNKFLISF